MKVERLERENFKYFSEIPTRWIDNDIFGHVNNVVYYSFFDTAVTNWLMREGGFEPKDGNLGYVVASSSCNYFESISHPAVLEIGIRVEGIGRSSVVYGLGIFKDEESKALAQGRFVHVAIDRQTQRSVPLPDVLRLALSSLS